MAAEARKRADEDRTRGDEERRRADEERKRADGERKRTDGERKRTDEVRLLVVQMMGQFVETQQAMLTAIAALTAEVTELRRQRMNRTDGD